MTEISAMGANKSECLENWGYVPGTPEAEDIWSRKLLLDEKAAQFYHSNKKDTGNIIPDIEPYRSQIDGSMVMSRTKHRVHLKDNGCIEVGNEKQQTKKEAPKGLREDIARAVYQHLGS